MSEAITKERMRTELLAMCGKKSRTWQQWRTDAECFEVMDDDSGFLADDFVDFEEALEGFCKCTLRVKPIELEADDLESELTDAEAYEQLKQELVPGVPDSKDEVTEAIAEAAQELATIEQVPNSQQSTSDVDMWCRQYEFLLKNPPKEGDIVTTDDGSKLRIEIELKVGFPAFVFARVYLPDTVLCKLGWFARKEHDLSQFGWKMILAPRARSEVIKRFGIVNRTIGVRSLKILHVARNLSSFTAEVHEW